jgi:hypothetical protein
MIDAQQLQNYSNPEDMEAPEEAPVQDFSALVEAIKKHNKDVQACCDEMDAEALKNATKALSTTDELILRQGFEDLEEDLKKALKDAGEIDPSEAHEIAGMAFEDKAVDDPYRLAGWLVRASKVAQQYQAEGEDEEEEVDEEDLEDIDEMELEDEEDEEFEE